MTMIQKRPLVAILSSLLLVLLVAADETTTTTSPSPLKEVIGVEGNHQQQRKVSLTKGRKSQCQTLWAKQTIAVGNVCLEADHENPEQLIVSFNTQHGWKLDSTHLWLGRNISHIPLDDIQRDPPQTQSQTQTQQQHQRRPNLDLFTYIKSDLNGKHSHYGFLIKLWYLDYACPDSKGTQFAAAAHATVRARSAVRQNMKGGAAGPTLQDAWAAENPATTSLEFQRQWLDFSFTLMCDLIPIRPQNAPERHHANLVPS